MRKQFVKTVETLLSENDKLVLLLGDIGVFGFKDSIKRYPDRAYNIGILEQSTVSLASGMALNGLIPIIHTIAPFMVNRALEQIKIDFGYQGLGGNFVSIGASYDYASLGPTHHCPDDVMILSSIPNLEIVVAGTSSEFNSLFRESYDNNNPTYYRLSEYENKNIIDVSFGMGNIIKKGSNATIVCFGNMLDTVMEATTEMDVTILYYTTINPFDSELLLTNFNENIIIVEPFFEGSLNHKITKILENKKYKLTNIGVPHEFSINYGTKKEHDEHLGLDIKGVKNKIQSCLE